MRVISENCFLYKEFHARRTRRNTLKEFVARIMRCSIKGGHRPMKRIFAHILIFFAVTCPLNADTLTLSVTAGWNLISLPLSVPDSRIEALFPIAKSQAFEYRQGYYPTDSISPGEAYWINFDSAKTFTFVGTFLTQLGKYNTSGWNLLGGISIPVLRSDVQTTPPNNLIGDLYEFRDSEYRTSDTLQLGRGYWTKFSTSGVVTLSCWDKEGALLSPPHASGLLSSPILTWKSSKCNEQYRLQIATDSAFVALVADTLMADTSIAFSFDCVDETYYWRVGLPSAVDPIWSQKQSFVWAYRDGALILPLDSQDVVETPLLSWRKADCADLYRLQIASDQEFSTLLLDSVLTDTIFQMNSLAVATDYWWRIQPKVGEEETMWSRARSFHTVRWDYVGLGTESVNKIVFDHTKPDILYAVSTSEFTSGRRGGIFKSMDGGANWDTLVRGVTALDIEMHPSNPSIFYVVLGINALTTPGILKTTDGGNTWTDSDSGMALNLEEGPIDIAIDSQNPNTLYCGTGGFFGGTIYKSTNAGTSWFKTVPESVADLYGGISEIVVNPLNSNIVYAIAYFNARLYRTTNAGQTWTNMNQGQLVNTVRLSPQYPDSIYIGTYTGMLISPNGGNSWEDISEGLPDSVLPGVIIEFIDSLRTKEIYITLYEPEHVYRFFRSRDGGMRWQHVPLPPVLPVHHLVRSLEILYSTTSRGIYKYIR